MDGNLLKEARLEKNWTQEQAALALDVTQAYLSMMEKGQLALESSSSPIAPVSTSSRS